MTYETNETNQFHSKKPKGKPSQKAIHYNKEKFQI